MRRVFKAAGLALALAAGFGVAAQAASLAVGKKAEVTVNAKKMDEEKKALWAKFGGFCAIKDWHPGVAKCEESKDGADTIRTLTLKDGGVLKEKLLESVDGRYKYSILSGPWPVKNYEAQFALTPDDDDEDEINFAWSAVFDPDGKPEKEVRALVDGVIKAGMENIKKLTAKPGAEDDEPKK